MASPQVIRVGILDRQPLVHGGVRYLLSAFPDLDVVGEAYNEGELIHCATQLDVALVELVALDHSIGETLRRLRGAAPALRSIVFTGCAEAPLVRDALAAGASGYLLKDSSALTLACTIRGVAAGQQVLAPEAAQALLAAGEQSAAFTESLTLRERDVLTLLTRGLSNQQIADQLCITVSTVKFHLAAICSKLGVTGRAQAIIRAYDLNLVPRLAVRGEQPVMHHRVAVASNIARSR